MFAATAIGRAQSPTRTRKVPGGLAALLHTLAIGFFVALTLDALALPNGVDAELPRVKRVQKLSSTVLFATLVAASIVGGLRLLVLLMKKKPL